MICGGSAPLNLKTLSRQDPTLEAGSIASGSASRSCEFGGWRNHANNHGQPPFTQPREHRALAARGLS